MRGAQHKRQCSRHTVARRDPTNSRATKGASDRGCPGERGVLKLLARAGAICRCGPRSRHGTATRSSGGAGSKTAGRGSAKAPDVQPHRGRKNPSGPPHPGPYGACTSGERRQAVSGCGEALGWGNGFDWCSAAINVIMSACGFRALCFLALFQPARSCKQAASVARCDL
jgi:hypothetical protein